MIVAKGQPWGLPLDGGVKAAPVSSDAELARMAAATEHLVAHLDGAAFDGDVARTIGVARPRSVSEQLRFTFDLGWVELDGGRTLPFVAHAIARRRLWQGPFAAVMNGAWVGEWYVGPRAHPNDGVLDVTCGALRLRARLQARGRVKTGTHVPHPDLKVARVAEWEHTFGRPTGVHLDGVAVGATRRLRAWTEPDRFSLVA